MQLNHRVSPIQAVLFDWPERRSTMEAVQSPQCSLKSSQSGIEITARLVVRWGYCRDHIAAVASLLPRLGRAWKAIHGAEPTDADVDAMYRDFLYRCRNKHCLPVAN
ncbi:MAG: hypothetical protein U0892_11760 [Pirellulales bacterium]